MIKQVLNIITTVGVLLTLLQAPTLAQPSIRLTGQDSHGSYVQLHHAVIEDITQEWSDTLFYPDTILVLSGVGLENYERVEKLTLLQNTPNPFDGVTDFTLMMPNEDKVSIEVFDMAGRKVTGKSQRLSAGAHTFRVWLNTPQQYLLMVRTTREKVSIKMVNNGSGGSSHIAYNGEYALSYTLKSSRSGGYEDGDLLRVTGFRQVNGLFLPSETMEITTIPDETVVLTFATLGELSGVRHFVDTNTVLIPDGVECDGDCFGTMNIHIYGYDPDAVLQSIEQLTYVRLKMEHERIGDLWIQLVCPNEQSATIMTKSWSGQSSQYNGCASLIPLLYWGWPGGNNEPQYAHFGCYDIHNSNPSCDPTVNPMGECWNYCWSMDTTHGQTYACGGSRVWESCNHFTTYNPSFNGSTNNYVAATDVTTLSNMYKPDESFSYLVGCPLNGLWQIRVLDALNADNGYVEEAEIAIDVPIACPIDSPYVASGAVTSVTRNSVVCSGEVLSEGLATVTERGFCWDTLPNPTLAASNMAVGSGMGTFTATLTGLTAGTPYYCRAYATNAYATVYGETVTFTTDANVAPSLMTVQVSSITDTSAIVGGLIVNDGGVPILERGICWGLTDVPTLTDSYVTTSTASDSFSCVLTNLTSASHYYARAYATNAVGTGYGDVVDFTTEIGLPAVALDSITNIGSSYATCHGALLTDGGDATAVVGLCWSANPTPTLTDNHVEWNGTVGAFQQIIGGIHDTLCYVRPYATNAMGTVYGNILSFAPDTIPTSVHLSLIHLDHNYATMRVTIVCDSSAAISNRGLCLDTLPQPDLSNRNFPTTSTDNVFDILVDSLERASTYYLRGYCVSNGTLLFSDDYLLLTVAEDGQPCIGTPTLTDHEGHVYNTVQVGSQCWMRTNLYTTHYTDGTAIPYGGTGAGAYSMYEPYYYKLTYNTDLLPTYGYAYNWKALTQNSTTTNVNVQGICPDGWHIPDASEFGVLRNYTGAHYACGEDTNSVAKALADVSGWNTSTANCSPGAYPSNNNLTGFSAYPSGGHYQYTFQVGEVAYIWSRTNHYTFDSTPYYSYAHVFKISYNGQMLAEASYYYDRAFPVRCVRNY